MLVTDLGMRLWPAGTFTQHCRDLPSPSQLGQHPVGQGCGWGWLRNPAAPVSLGAHARRGLPSDPVAQAGLVTLASLGSLASLVALLDPLALELPPAPEGLCRLSGPSVL